MEDAAGSLERRPARQSALSFSSASIIVGRFVHTYTHTQICVSIYMYIYIYVNKIHKYG